MATLPGAFPAEQGSSSEHIKYEVAAAKSLDLSENAKPYSPEVSAKHLPESQHQGIKSLSTSELHDENVRPNDEETTMASSKWNIKSGSAAEEGTITIPVASTVSGEPVDDVDVDLPEDEIIPVDPDALSRPKDDVACEQEREESFMEEVSPAIFISNREKVGNGEKQEPPIAAGPSAEREHDESIGLAAPAVSPGAAEDLLLADYLGSGAGSRSVHQPQDEALIKNDDPPSATDDGSPSYKPHRLENIQEKTRDNRLPPLPPSPEATASTSEPPRRVSTGSDSLLSKLKRGRRRSSTTSKDGSEWRRSGSMGSRGGGALEQDVVEPPPLTGIQESHGHNGAGAVEKEDEGYQSPSPPARKVGMMDKIKGEFKIVIGELQRNKEKVEAGKRMMGRA